MKSRFLALCLLSLIPAAVAHADSVGGCGFGSKLMHGSKGIAPQVLAVTTNGILGNQTFGISTGTIGCSQDGVVQSNWKTAMFIDANKTMLAQDMSRGSGETLDSLSQLMGVKEEHKAHFYALAKENFNQIFPESSVSTDQVIASLNAMLANDAELSEYVAS